MESVRCKGGSALGRGERKCGQRSSSWTLDGAVALKHGAGVASGAGDHPLIDDAIQMARAVGLEFVRVPQRALPTVYRLMSDHASGGPRPSVVELLVGHGDVA